MDDLSNNPEAMQWLHKYRNAMTSEWFLWGTSIGLEGYGIYRLVNADFSSTTEAILISGFVLNYGIYIVDHTIRPARMRRAINAYNR